MPLSFASRLALGVCARGVLRAFKAHRARVEAPPREVREDTAGLLAGEVLRLVRTLETSSVNLKDPRDVREVVAELLDEFVPVDGERMLSVSRDQADRIKAAGAAVEGGA